MENREKIINWIGISLAQSPGSLTESFYFDKEKQLFFSIHVVDYAMLNEDLEINPAAKVSYSEKTQLEIVEWIKRLEKEDSSIISVPQKGLIDDKLKEIEAIEFLNEHEIDSDVATVWEVESHASISIDLTVDQKSKKPLDKRWWEFWK